MRIAFFHNLSSGGAKRAAAEMAKRLALRHRVDAYALSCSEHDFADLRPHVATHHVLTFAPRRLLQPPFGRLNQAIRCADLVRLNRVARTVAARIDGGGYDVALVHPCQFEQAPGVLRHLQRTRSVYYCQEPRRALYEPMPSRPYDDHHVGRRRFLNRFDPLPTTYRWMLRRRDCTNMRSASSVLVSSRFMADTARRLYDVETEVSPLGVDVDVFRPTGEEKRHLVLSVGSLTPLKAFDFLVEAMAHYPPRRRPVLVIVSNFQNGPERSYIEALAQRRAVDLQLLTNVSDPQLVRLYNEAKVVAYAPRREPFGLVPLEAMACATPVVAVAEGGIPESVVDGETGALVDRDPQRFAAAIQQVVEQPALSCRYGENGRSHVLGHWTWERSVAVLEEHLREGPRHRATIVSRAS